MLEDNLEIENYIKEHVKGLKEKINFNDRFEYSFIYYLTFKNDFFIKRLNINQEEQKNVINIQIRNFMKNVNQVIEERESRHPYFNYDISMKILKYAYANEHNLFSEMVKIDSHIQYDKGLNIKTIQFMFYMFRNLELLTNFNLENLNMSYDFYNILCNKLTYSYITKVPIFEKFTPNKSIYYDINSLTSYPSIVMNHLSILFVFAPEFKYINYYFITGKHKLIFGKYNNMYNWVLQELDLMFNEEELVSCLEKYMTHIEAQSEPTKYEEQNIQICDVLLKCFEEYILNICRKDNVFIRRDKLIYVREMLPYHYENNIKKEIFRKKIEEIMKKLEVSI